VLFAEPLKLNKIYTKFRFFRPSPEESTVGVVYSFPVGTMGDGTHPDKTRPFPDGFKKVSVGKAKMGTMRGRLRSLLHHLGASDDGLLRYAAGIIIAPEYTPVAAPCRSRRSPGARGAPEEMNIED